MNSYMKYLGIIIVIFGNVFLYSQEKVRFGIVAHHNITRFNELSGSESYNTKAGFGGGGYIKLPLDKNFSIGIELHYITHRFYYASGDRFMKFTYDASLSYLLLPFVVKADIDMNILKPFCEAGIFMSQLVDHSANEFAYKGMNGSHLGYSVPFRFEPSKDGVLLGLGFEVPLGADITGLIGYRYYPGLNSVGSVDNYNSYRIPNSWVLNNTVIYIGFEK